jgi:hypothetical protein
MIRKEILETVFKRDRYYRSQIIYLATTVDELISECIAWHFCQDEKKHLAFMSLLFNRGEVSFSKKIDIFKFILKNEYSDLYEETKGLTNKITALREIRNKFAHSTLAMDLNNLLKADTGIYIRVLDRRGNKEDVFFSEDDLKANTDEYAGLMMKLMELKFEFERRAKGCKHGKLTEVWKNLLEEE